MKQTIILLAIFHLAEIVVGSNFTWTWPDSTSQCDKVQLAVYGGKAPWTLFLAPLYGIPVLWTLGDAGDLATPTAPATFTIPLQLDSGTSYVPYILDNETGAEYNMQGAKPIQTVAGSSDTSCMSGLLVTPQQFYFNIGGETAQCENVQIYYSDSIGVGPYTLTVIPLDGSNHPYDVMIGTQNPLVYNFGMQLPRGTRFTVMLNNANGYGTGGIGGIYEVASGDTSCNVLSASPTGTWPANLAPTSVGPLTVSVPAISGTPIRPSSTTTSQINVVPPISSSYTSSASTTQTSPSPSSSPAPAKSNAAVIGGAVGGGAAVLIVLAILAFWWLKRKRRDARLITPVDLGDEPSQGLYDPKIEPYASPGLPDVPRTMTDRGSVGAGATGYDRGSYMSPTSPSQGTYFLDSYDGHPNERVGSEPEVVYHQDGGSVSNSGEQGNSQRIEMPPSYGQASGKN